MAMAVMNNAEALMKRNPDFLLRDVAGTLIVVPVGAAVTVFPGMITVNASGAYLWELLENEQSVESLTDALLERYEVNRAQAEEDIRNFLTKLEETGAVI